MKILVTGAAGFIGSHLSERLLAMGHQVVGLDCFTDYYARSLKDLNARDVKSAGGHFLALDLAVDDLTPAVSGCHFVFHLAAQPGISATTPYEQYLRNNLTATHRLLMAARRSDTLLGFINIATSSVYGADATRDEDTAPEPTSDYGVTKLAAEQLVLSHARDEGFPATSLRLFSVYGPRERPEKLYPKLIKAMLEGHSFPLFEGSEKHLRSFTYVGDIVDGLVAAMQRMDACVGEVFNIGSDSAITTGEGIRIVEEIIGHPAIFERMPKRPGDQLRTHADIAKARQVLEYNPTTTPRDGLAKEVSWYRDQIHGQIDF